MFTVRRQQNIGRLLTIQRELLHRYGSTCQCYLWYIELRYNIRQYIFFQRTTRRICLECNSRRRSISAIYHIRLYRRRLPIRKLLRRRRILFSPEQAILRSRGKYKGRNSITTDRPSLCKYLVVSYTKSVCHITARFGRCSVAECVIYP